MSFVGSMWGAGHGSDWQAQGAPGTNIFQSPVTTQQATSAYDTSQAALQQQQAFLQALQGQNGIGNQSNVYNQLQGVANGTGPNPAQAMLAQQTGANVANQASLMAGQRGASSNVGLMARQAAQQGANTQQQAVGQGATMQANQSLNALGQMGSLASQQVGQQAAATTGYNQAAQSEQQNLLNAIGQSNTANATILGGENAANANIQVENTKTQSGIFGGLLQGVLAEGGMVKDAPKVKMANGGAPQQMATGGLSNNSYAMPNSSYGGPKSSSAQFLYGSAPGQNTQAAQNSTTNYNMTSDPGSLRKGVTNVVKKGVGAVQSMFSSPTSVPGMNSANQLKMPSVGDSAYATPGPSLGANTDLGGAVPMPDLAPEMSLPASSAGSTSGLGVSMDSAPDAAADAGSNAASDAGAGAAEDAGADAATSAAVDEGGGDALAALLAKGGKVNKYDDGGAVADDDSKSDPIGSILALLAKGGKVPALVSPGERYLPPSAVAQVASGKKNPMEAGEKIPGKAKVKGNSYANDTVPKTLDEGGIVLPKSVTESAHPQWAAHAFVKAILAKQNMKKAK